MLLARAAAGACAAARPALGAAAARPALGAARRALAAAAPKAPPPPGKAPGKPAASPAAPAAAAAPPRAAPPPQPLSALGAFLASPAFEPNSGAPSTPETLVVRLRLKAFHKFYLNKFVLALAARTAELGLAPPSQVFLPRRRKLWTLLRSPHVDKRARDQFERVTHLRLVTLALPRGSEQLELAYRLLSGIVTLAPGVEVTAQYAASMGETVRTHASSSNFAGFQ